MPKWALEREPLALQDMLDPSAAPSLAQGSPSSTLELLNFTEQH